MCGRNDKNQINNSITKCKKNMQNTYYLDKFTLIKNNHKYKNIICGGSHTIGITTSNEVYGWGSNIDKQLCCDHKEDEIIYNINTDNVQSIYCGNNITILLVEEHGSDCRPQRVRNEIYDTEYEGLVGAGGRL